MTPLFVTVPHAREREQALPAHLAVLVDLYLQQGVLVKVDGISLTGDAWGERLDHERHDANVEVKGATLHMLSVREEEGRFIAQCVVDV